MDVLRPNAETVVLNNLVCVQNIPIRTRYGVTEVVVFADFEKKQTYAWATSTSSGMGFHVNESYDIRAKLYPEDNNKLTHVEELFTHDKKSIGSVKSEQPDAQDVLLGLANYK